MNYTRGWPIEPVSRSAKSAAATLGRITLAKRQEFLQAVPLFADLKKRQVGSIARITETARFQPGHEIVVEGTPGDFCCIIVEGTADVIKDGSRIARLGPGDLFGELAILDPALAQPPSAPSPRWWQYGFNETSSSRSQPPIHGSR